MNLALLSLALPLVCGLLLLLSRHRGGGVWVLATSLGSLMAATVALWQVVDGGAVVFHIGGWKQLLAIRFQLEPIRALLLAFTALIVLLVAAYRLRSRFSASVDTSFWVLTALLHASLAALWLSTDLFNWYVTLELLALVSVALVTLAGRRALRPAVNYLLLSLVASLFYLLGVAVFYGHYGMLDILRAESLVRNDGTTAVALLLMTLGLMLKGAIWPLHLWLPPAHGAAPTAVSALLSALVVKGPLFILTMLWAQLAPPELARQMGPLLAAAGLLALLSGGWSSFRAPYLKTMVAYSTVAQMGYAVLALGLLLLWQQLDMLVALWLFVVAHGLAKATLFLAAGEMQESLGSKRVTALRGASQTMPVAMFAFAVAGGSLIGLPPSGGFLAKWVLLQPLFQEPGRWFWALGVLLATLISAAYVFRVVALAFDRAERVPPDFQPDSVAQWLTMVPALLVWGMALVGESLILWLTGVAG